MKKCILYFVLAVFGYAAFSAPVSIEKAQKIAVHYMSHYASAKTDFHIQNVVIREKQGITTFYIFNFVNGGYVMVSADDAVIPVLGYSETGTYDYDVLPLQMKSWLNGYDAEIVFILTEGIDNTETAGEWQRILAKQFPEEKLNVPALLTTKWNQDCYYNEFCPTVPGYPGICNRAYAGCVATAMAQIMKYWNWPVTGNGSYSYTHPTYGPQTANFAVTYDWPNMPQQLFSTSTTAVATLIRHCGVSVNMNYSPSGSGAYSQDVPNALVTFFKYKNTASLKYKANYTNTAWINLLKAELDAARPVFYAGADNSYGGHAFVCDGYNTSNQFHFNWGWSGWQDGYFTIGSLNPTGYAFNQDNCAITGIEPQTVPPAWVLQNTGFTTAYRGIDQIFIVNPNVVWAKAYDGTNSSNYIREFTKTTNGGSTWTPGVISFTGSTSFGVANIYAFDANTAFACMFPLSGTGGAIAKTINGGSSWTKLTTPAFTGSWANFVHFFNSNDAVAMGDPVSNMFYITRTTNGGSSWTQVTSGIPAALADEYGVVRQFCAAGNTVWFGTTKGRIFKSTDKGATWTVTTILSGGYQVTPVFKDANTGIAILMNYSTGAYQGIYKTTNGGSNWTLFTPSGSYVKYPYMAYVPGTTSTWFNVSPGPDYGSSYSTNDCASFINIDAGSVQYTTVSFYDINTGWAGGFNSSSTAGGIWKWQNVLLVGTEETSTAGEDIIMYPNPASDRLHIEFPLFASAKASVSVYNLTGALVAAAEFDPSTGNLCTIDLSAKTPGLYLVRIVAGNQISSQKLLIAR
jgi:photosystem II stability/assembly factor-like uncharacterized protein